MHITVMTEVNLHRILREDVQSPEQLIEIAFAALDQCAFRLRRNGDTEKSDAVTNARTALTHTVQTIWPAEPVKAGAHG